MLYIFYIVFSLFVIALYNGSYNNHKPVFNVICKLKLQVSGDAVLILMCFKSETLNLVLVVRRLQNLLDVC